MRVLMAVDEIRRLAEPADEGAELRRDLGGEQPLVEQPEPAAHHHLGERDERAAARRAELHGSSA